VLVEGEDLPRGERMAIGPLVQAALLWRHILQGLTLQREREGELGTAAPRPRSWPSADLVHLGGRQIQAAPMVDPQMQSPGGL